MLTKTVGISPLSQMEKNQIVQFLAQRSLVPQFIDELSSDCVWMNPTISRIAGFLDENEFNVMQMLNQSQGNTMAFGIAICNPEGNWFLIYKLPTRMFETKNWADNSVSQTNNLTQALDNLVQLGVIPPAQTQTPIPIQTQPPMPAPPRNSSRVVSSPAVVSLESYQPPQQEEDNEDSQTDDEEENSDGNDDEENGDIFSDGDEDEEEEDPGEQEEPDFVPIGTATPPSRMTQPVFPVRPNAPAVASAGMNTEALLAQFGQGGLASAYTPAVIVPGPLKKQKIVPSPTPETIPQFTPETAPQAVIQNPPVPATTTPTINDVLFMLEGCLKTQVESTPSEGREVLNQKIQNFLTRTQLFLDGNCEQIEYAHKSPYSGEFKQ